MSTTVTVFSAIFVCTAFVAAICGLLTFIGWLAVQWLGHLHYLFGEGGKYGKHSGD